MVSISSLKIDNFIIWLIINKNDAISHLDEIYGYYLSSSEFFFNFSEMTSSMSRDRNFWTAL